MNALSGLQFDTSESSEGIRRIPRGASRDRQGQPPSLFNQSKIHRSVLAGGGTLRCEETPLAIHQSDPPCYNPTVLTDQLVLGEVQVLQSCQPDEFGRNPAWQGSGSNRTYRNPRATNTTFNQLLMQVRRQDLSSDCAAMESPQPRTPRTPFDDAQLLANAVARPLVPPTHFVLATLLRLESPCPRCTTRRAVLRRMLETPLQTRQSSPEKTSARVEGPAPSISIHPQDA